MLVTSVPDSSRFAIAGVETKAVALGAKVFAKPSQSKLFADVIKSLSRSSMATLEGA